MKPDRFTEEQIISILQQTEAGAKAADLCRQHRMGEAAFYKWKAKYGGLPEKMTCDNGPEFISRRLQSKARKQELA